MLKITDADEIRDSPKTPIASVAQNILGVSDGGENKRFQGEEHSSDEKGRDKRAKLTTIMPERRATFAHCVGQFPNDQAREEVSDNSRQSEKRRKSNVVMG